MTSPGSPPGINPTVTSGKPFQGTPSLEKTFSQRLDSPGDRVGVQAALGGSSCPSQSFASTFQASVFSRGMSGTQSGNFLAPPEGSSRGNLGSVPWFFRPPFLCAESFRGLPSSLGPFCPQQISEENSFPHGWKRFLQYGQLSALATGPLPWT